MKKIVENLKGQSVEHRKNVMHLITFFCAIVLIILWVFSLGKNLSNEDTKENIKNDLQPINALKDNIVGGYKNVNVLDNANNLQLENTEESYPKVIEIQNTTSTESPSDAEMQYTDYRDALILEEVNSQILE